MKDKPPFRLAPGQSRPLSFEIAHSHVTAAEVTLEATYKVDHLPTVCRTCQATYIIQSQKAEELQKITYLHPGGIVSYGILRPPSEKALRSAGPDASFAILICLHGAGVETDSDLIRHAFNDAPELKAWLLFPSGVTTWSGDDWRKSPQWTFLTVLLLTPDKIVGESQTRKLQSLQYHGGLRIRVGRDRKSTLIEG